MYLRRCRGNKGKTDPVYWQLVESYRAERGPRQRVVAYLGDIAQPQRDGIKQAASGQEGIYQQQMLADDQEPEVLRSNIKDWDAEQLWQAYVQLAQAEAAFRIQKDDLGIRPIWHQKKERVQAHILVCFLAYVLWKTIGQLCQGDGLGDEPRQVMAEISQIKMVDVILPTKAGIEIRRRCISEPTIHQAILLDKLRLHLPRSLEVQKM